MANRPGEPEDPPFTQYNPTERFLVAVGLKRAAKIVGRRADDTQRYSGREIEALESARAEIEQDATVMEREGR